MSNFNASAGFGDPNNVVKTKTKVGNDSGAEAVQKYKELLNKLDSDYVAIAKWILKPFSLDVCDEWKSVLDCPGYQQILIATARRELRKYCSLIKGKDTRHPLIDQVADFVVDFTCITEEEKKQPRNDWVQQRSAGSVIAAQVKARKSGSAAAMKLLNHLEVNFIWRTRSILLALSFLEDLFSRDLSKMEKLEIDDESFAIIQNLTVSFLTDGRALITVFKSLPKSLLG